MSEWISVKDRLPGERTRVMGLHCGAVYTVSHKGDLGKPKFWWVESVGAAEFEDFTHWMPLPDPPEESA